ncbi:hypothetical protein OXB_0751 [Bacillus sp. OxB-1]|uniref:hypothetical protein n=1 Tax=Bacillus sp. (strain OxB-1) TaxID=98228 RepID=UPI000581CB95|nr:hypothetical protein [Bacillus sp. OxB-1]BAQ09223.1 hypothetical protein OXB_0751 [Bacillus sp. OxB-1]
MKKFVDSNEMERRRDKDVHASLRMVGEGAPDYGATDPQRTERYLAARLSDLEGFDEDQLPAAYQ